MKDTYSTSTWQNETCEAANVVAFGHDGAITRLGRALGLDGYPTVATYNGSDIIDKVPLQYIENHDHERFITHFGRTGAPDDLFSEGNRDAWWKLQPYLIALLLAKGAPLLWEGQELCESYWIPGSGRARVGILRPVRWNFFYDEAGRGIVTLVRKLLAFRKARTELRGGDFYLYDEPDRYQNRGVLMYSRWSGSSFTLVGVNFTASDVTVPPVRGRTWSGCTARTTCPRTRRSLKGRSPSRRTTAMCGPPEAERASPEMGPYPYPSAAHR